MKRKRKMTRTRAAMLVAEHGAKLTNGHPYHKYVPYRDVALRVLHWHEPYYIKKHKNKGRWRAWLHKEHPDLYKVVFK